MSELFAGSDGELFAILDGGRRDAVHTFTHDCELPWLYLHDNVVDPTFMICAPRVIAFGEWPGSTLTRLLDDLWGDHCGVFVRASVGLATLRRHLASLLVAELPDGTQALFRYFDPRVLHAFLPTCTANELASVFGPISEFILEGAEQPDLLVRYRNVGGSLQTERIALSG